MKLYPSRDPTPHLSKIDGVKFSLETLFAPIPISETRNPCTGQLSDFNSAFRVVHPGNKGMSEKLFGPLFNLAGNADDQHLLRHWKL